MIDGVNAQIEMQTVKRSYQLAVKERDCLPPREKERLFQIAAGLSVCTELSR